MGFKKTPKRKRRGVLNTPTFGMPSTFFKREGGKNTGKKNVKVTSVCSAPYPSKRSEQREEGS